MIKYYLKSYGTRPETGQEVAEIRVSNSNNGLDSHVAFLSPATGSGNKKLTNEEISRIQLMLTRANAGNRATELTEIVDKEGTSGWGTKE